MLLLLLSSHHHMVHPSLLLFNHHQLMAQSQATFCQVARRRSLVQSQSQDLKRSLASANTRRSLPKRLQHLLMVQPNRRLLLQPMNRKSLAQSPSQAPSLLLFSQLLSKSLLMVRLSPLLFNQLPSKSLLMVKLSPLKYYPSIKKSPKRSHVKRRSLHLMESHRT